MAESTHLLDGSPTPHVTLADETERRPTAAADTSIASVPSFPSPIVIKPENDLTQSTTDEMQKEIRKLQSELDEARSLVAVANYSLEESLETERRKCREEVATLHQLMKENIQEAVRQTKDQNEAEIRRLKNAVTRLELEIQELKATYDKENPNVFSAVTKTLARKVNNLTNPSILTPSTAATPAAATSSDVSGEDYLEQSMKRAQEDVEVLRSLVLPLEEEIKALKDKLRSTDEQLRVHENTQADLVRGTQLLAKLTADQSLESVIAGLMNTFAQTPDEDVSLFLAIVNAQRTTLQEERERLRSQLQETCQLLENERRQHRELRRTWQKANDQFIQSQTLPDATKEEKGPLKGFPIKDKFSPLFSRISPVLKRKSSVHSPSKEAVDNLEDSLFATLQSTRRDPSTENLLNFSVNSIDSNSSFGPGEGSFARTTEPQPVPFCSECQTLASTNKQLTEEKVQMEKLLAKAREESERLSNLIKDMENKWTEVAKDYEKQVDTLFGNIDELQGQLSGVTTGFKQFRNQAQETLRQLQFDRQTVSAELVRLQEENDFLVGKHSLHAEQLQNEMINLPDNLQDLQLVCLSIREDLISAKVAKEAIEKRWQTDVPMLQEQIINLQKSKETLEISLTNEIDYLREQLGLMRSVHSQLDEETSRKATLELALKQAKEQLAEEKERTSESSSAKAKIENEVQQLRNRVSSLQQDLETSEAVQRDFVQLSQQLQVQLEKIRQSEKELRWQYEDDVDNCSECRHTFNNVTKRKHHCRHCCQIFCGDCLRKTVTSGPNKRQSRVCNVCYYLLVQESAPFFSSEPQPSN